MRLGTVIGRVTLHRQEPVYTGGCLLVVQPLSREQFAQAQLCRKQGLPAQPLAPGSSLVVYDELGADLGHVIGFTEGAEASQPFTGDAPVDAYAACIVDQIDYHPPEAK